MSIENQEKRDLKPKIAQWLASSFVPSPDVAQIDVKMVVFGIIGDAPALHGLGDFADGLAVDAVDAEIDRPSVHMKAFFSNVAVASGQPRVGFGRAITGKNLEGNVFGQTQPFAYVDEIVDELGVDLSRDVSVSVAHKFVDFFHSGGIVAAFGEIDDVDFFSIVGVYKNDAPRRIAVGLGLLHSLPPIRLGRRSAVFGGSSDAAAAA